MKKRTFFNLTVMFAMVAFMTLSSCEELEEPVIEKEAVESTLKGVENPYYFHPQMDRHPSYTMTQSSVDWITGVPPYVYGQIWRKLENGGPTDYYGTVAQANEGHFSMNRLRIRGSDSGVRNFLVRVEPTLDAIEHDGKFGLLMKGPSGETGAIRLVVATSGEGDVNIIPDEDEEHLVAWYWRNEPGVCQDLSSQPQFINLTGDWQWVEFDVDNEFFKVQGQYPNENFDEIAPYDDDVYVWIVASEGEESFYIDFMVNGQVSTQTPTENTVLTGPNNVENGETYAFTFNEEVDYQNYVWSVSQSRGTIMSGQGTKTAQIRMDYTGSILVQCQSKFNQMGLSAPQARMVMSSDPPPPQPPSPPTITGASSVGIYDVEAYTMPSGKEDYEWTLPYGTSHIQEYSNVKVIQFTSTGNKTIEGKYKENGVWSSVGYKSVYVSY